MAPPKAHILPDRLAPDLKVWFVGTAAGPRSAAERAYYAHPGNRFWRAVHEAKITPRQFAPHEYPLMLDLGIGLTDFCKVSWGVDAQIDKDHFDVAGFTRKVKRLKPRTLAFTSKTAASLWLGKSTGRIQIGRQDTTQDDGPAVFVLPSPSGLATSYWTIAPWKQLSAHLISL
ncbi:MAG TPA: mismatch-specific DNA-glycosylase [Hyphomonadaceae bacterium]|mgnify:CR=1 FL=1|jgi:TDG/mug DNA glycosylase family protein|nr:mismatch-specific DNA-glycosylase [Hyphomonadaceae bacterium]HPN04870.1 mismatch-specific DNA-glycosylase [Hyphomonadaceae bacterium]